MPNQPTLPDDQWLPNNEAQSVLNCFTVNETEIFNNESKDFEIITN